MSGLRFSQYFARDVTRDGDRRSTMPTVHLLHGLPGCGKTTFARTLEAECRAVRFTHDEWMVQLFGANPPAETFAESARRISELIWEHAARVMRVERDVILDLGFWSRESRDGARARVRALGAIPRLYAFDVSEAEMRARVRERSTAMPPGALFINEQAFDVFLTRFEPLGPDEEYVLVRGTA
jgi:predicted kinase